MPFSPERASFIPQETAKAEIEESKLGAIEGGKTKDQSDKEKRDKERITLLEDQFSSMQNRIDSLKTKIQERSADPKYAGSASERSDLNMLLMSYELQAKTKERLEEMSDPYWDQAIWEAKEFAAKRSAAEAKDNAARLEKADAATKKFEYNDQPFVYEGWEHDDPQQMFEWGERIRLAEKEAGIEEKNLAEAGFDMTELQRHNMDSLRKLSSLRQEFTTLESIIKVKHGIDPEIDLTSFRGRMKIAAKKIASSEFRNALERHGQVLSQMNDLEQDIASTRLLMKNPEQYFKVEEAKLARTMILRAGQMAEKDQRSSLNIRNH